MILSEIHVDSNMVAMIHDYMRDTIYRSNVIKYSLQCTCMHTSLHCCQLAILVLVYFVYKI